MNSVTQAWAECTLLLKCSQPTLSVSSLHGSVPHTAPLNRETLSMEGDPVATLCSFNLLTSEIGMHKSLQFQHEIDFCVLKLTLVLPDSSDSI